MTSCVYPPFVGSTTLGIYQLAGTSMTLAANEPGVTVRPSDFTGSGSSRVWNLTRQ